MGLDDLSRYRQSHACPRNALACFLTAIELFEYSFLFRGWNPGTGVGHMQHDGIAVFFGTDTNDRGRRSILQRIRNKLPKGERAQIRIRIQVRERAVQAYLNVPPIAETSELR